MYKIQLKIEIKDIHPPIWRRVLVSSEMTLLELHDLIQLSFGWSGTHLFMFEIDAYKFVHSSDWEEDAFRFQAAEEARLNELIPKVVPEGHMFFYEYDMGDGWLHEIMVEEICTNDIELRSPLCLAGQRACPPEDVGGTWGYESFLEAIQDPHHPEHNDYLTWVGGEFDSEEFELKFINREIRTYLRDKKLARASSWATDLGFFKPVGDFISDWTESLSAESEAKAETLHFRKDIVSMMKYLQENKVVGTKATGNFPLKHIRVIAERFVKPPELDTKIGDRVYKLRTEDEVPEFQFIHQFANFCGLILGGEGMRWEVSLIGEIFLNIEPKNQVWFLMKNWMMKFDWYYLYRFDDVESCLDLPTFTALIINVLLSYPVQEPIKIGKLVEDLDHLDPDWVRFKHTKISLNWKRYYLLDIVVRPFELFGIIETVSAEIKEMHFYDVTQFVMTEFGVNMLRSFLV